MLWSNAHPTPVSTGMPGQSLLCVLRPMRERLIGSAVDCRRKSVTGGFEREGATRCKWCAPDLQKPAPCNKGWLGPGLMAASSRAFTSLRQLTSGPHSIGH